MTTGERGARARGMLGLDHLPFYAADLGTLTDAFEALGFQVSPRGAYRVPGDAAAVFPNRCVFTRRGWFDLLLDDTATAGAVRGPAACLFRTDSLDTAAAALAGMRTTPP